MDGIGDKGARLGYEEEYSVSTSDNSVVPFDFEQLNGTKSRHRDLFCATIANHLAPVLLRAIIFLLSLN